MTATQLFQQFVNGLYELEPSNGGPLTRADYDRLHELSIIVYDVLSPYIRDENEYYVEGRHEPDVEFDYHAVDDAKFERMEAGYEEVWSSQ